MSVLSTFMESYNQNVQITGVQTDLDRYFAESKPVSYEQMIESIYETQYGCEAVLVMAEQATKLQEAGVAVVNEGISDVWEAVKDRVKKIASDLKGLAVTICQKIKEFFQNLYDKANPVDKVMQMTNKKVVTYADIKSAKATGWKFPGKYKKIGEINVDKVDLTNAKGLDQLTANKGYGDFITKVGEMRLHKDITESILSEQQQIINKYKDAMKSFWDSINPLLIDSKMEKVGGKGTVLYCAGADVEDQELSENEWKTIVDYALNGQAKSKQYMRSVQKECQETVKTVETALKGIELVNKSAENKANASKYVNLMVQRVTLKANFTTKVCHSIVLPIMRKQHNAAISTFIYVQRTVKKANKAS